jgi:hypothetical protein
MMAAYVLTENKPLSLTARIRGAERQIVIRQRRVDVRAADAVRTIQRQLTAPASLLLAGGVGFIIGELTKRRVSKLPGTADKTDAGATTPLKTALNLITSVHTLYTALPVAWMMKSLHQAGTAEQPPAGQFRPAAADRQGNP